MIKTYVKNSDEIMLFDFNKMNIYEVKNNEIQKVKNKIKETKIEKIKKFEGIIQKEKLDFLQLMITNKCNMNCKYCFANNGNYNKLEQHMDSSDGVKIIDSLFNEYKEIKEISFFGGEPLINYKIIEEICLHIEKNYPIPKYSIVTNLTYLNDEIIKILKKHNIRITVSLDGPKEINDINRIFKNGKSTFNIVYNNLKKISKETKLLKAIEVTYTGKGDKKEIVKYLKKEFNISFIVLNNSIEVTNKKRNKFFYNRNLSKEIKNKLEIFIEFGVMDRSLFLIFQKIGLKEFKNYYCEVGENRISIMPNGDIYPCQLLVKDFDDLGNVILDGIKNNLKIKEFIKRIKKSTKNFEECDTCKAKILCQECIAENYLETKSFNIKNNDGYCNYLREEVEKIADLLIDLYLNQDKFEKFNNQIKKFTL
jgi:uncharacterized protein